MQRLLRSQIQALDADLMVISEEFDQWVESSRRIDLLCIDRDADLVVVELKRSTDGGYMELQAIRYAAMISKMKFSDAVEAYKRYVTRLGRDDADAEQRILSFLGWSEPDDDRTSVGQSKKIKKITFASSSHAVGRDDLKRSDAANIGSTSGFVALRNRKYHPLPRQ